LYSLLEYSLLFVVSGNK